MGIANDQAWYQQNPWSTAFAQAVIERFEDSQARLQSSRAHFRMQRSWAMYYSRGADGRCDETELATAGDNGLRGDEASDGEAHPDR